MNFSIKTRALKKGVATLGLLVGLNGAVIAQQSYDPPKSRLDEKAGRSTELYVSPDFNFDTHKSVSLDLLVLDDQGNPMASQMITVWGASTDEHVSDEGGDNTEDNQEDVQTQFSRLGLLLTDEAGMVVRTLEVGSNIRQLKLEVAAVGIENQVSIDLNQIAHLRQVFE